MMSLLAFAMIMASFDTIVQGTFIAETSLAPQVWRKAIRSWRSDRQLRTVSETGEGCVAGHSRNWRDGRGYLGPE
jgi:hypothetical protein